MHNKSLPLIIQGGMGAAVSGWRLANAVSRLGQLGVVSGTAIDLVMTRRLQVGDPGGHVRRALAAFPFQETAERILKTYFIPGGKPENEPFKTVPVHTIEGSRKTHELTVAANFAEVYLAREGHDNPVGINFLEKIQLPHLPSLYGAMLAGVAYVIMGAGIPMEIPGAIEASATHSPSSYPLYVQGALRGEEHRLHFNPRELFDVAGRAELKRPKFLPIIAAEALAIMLLRKANGPVDGFVIEGPTAGGHNAPPRGAMKLTEDGQPIYGERDVINLDAIKALDRPFWLAGSYGSSDKVAEALALGAAGVQVGTAFAMCEESGMDPKIRRALLDHALDGTAKTFTDPLGSPTGFPFKVAMLEGTLSDNSLYHERERICDLGFLRQAYRLEDGKIGYRCPGEPEAKYLHKGGKPESMEGRKCLCNGLSANVGLPQVRKDGYKELPLITLGDDYANVSQFIKPGARDYTAADVINALLSKVETAATT